MSKSVFSSLLIIVGGAFQTTATLVAMHDGGSNALAQGTKRVSWVGLGKISFKLKSNMVSSIEHSLTRNAQTLKMGVNEKTEIHQQKSSQYKLYPLAPNKGDSLSCFGGHAESLV